MSKENNVIEEMAWDLCDIPKHPSIKSCEECGSKNCHATYYAERAINKGYRKQREGVWKFNKDGSGTCSECRSTQKNVWDDDHHQNYCGVCGAKMKGE